LTGEIRELNAVAVIQDLTAPEIISMHPGNYGKYNGYELHRLSIVVNDNLSGINPEEDTFSLELDQENVRFSYQPQKKEISYNLTKTLSTGEHTLSVKVQDRAGNEVQKTITFGIK
ncbi:MAG: Ig-like domain-containing protein, partial [Candidatus Neomarinimicrobiota bacterium]